MTQVQPPPRERRGRTPEVARGRPSLPVRWTWVSLGGVCVGVGGLGIVLPVLPSTVFFLAAAACFSRSSPRLEAWVHGLPAVGPAVRDLREGLGMPRRAKAVTMVLIAVAGILSGALSLESVTTRVLLALLCLAGMAAVGWWVPTRETMLARRAAPEQHRARTSPAEDLTEADLA